MNNTSTIVPLFAAEQVFLAPVHQTPSETSGPGAVITPALGLVLTEAAGRLECLARKAEADAEQLRVLRETAAAASCHLEAFAFRLAADYLLEKRAGWPDRLLVPIAPGNCIAFPAPTRNARGVASFKAACDELLLQASGLTTQADDAALFSPVIAGGYRSEAAALRFAAAALAPVTSASDFSLVA